MPQETKAIQVAKSEDAGQVIRLDFRAAKRKFSFLTKADYRNFSFCQLLDEAQELMKTITCGEVTQPVRLKTKSLVTELRRRVSL
jgi:hypothetical protein